MFLDPTATKFRPSQAMLDNPLPSTAGWVILRGCDDDGGSCPLTDSRHAAPTKLRSKAFVAFIEVILELVEVEPTRPPIGLLRSVVDVSWWLLNQFYS